jgi:hypothetical protein
MWGSPGTWFNWADFSLADATAEWVWHTPEALLDAPYDSAFYYASLSLPAPATLILSFTADNGLDVSIDGVLRASQADWSSLGTVLVALGAGEHVVELRASNWGGPAGAIFSAVDASTREVLLNTGVAHRGAWGVSATRCDDGSGIASSAPPAVVQSAGGATPAGGGADDASYVDYPTFYDSPAPAAVECAALSADAFPGPLSPIFYVAPAAMRGGWFTWFDFSAIDAAANWIWYTPNAVADAPTGEAFFYATLSLDAPADVLISMSADNQVDVSVNGALQGSNVDWGGAVTVRAALPAGANGVAVRGVNWGGPAGLIVSFRDAATEAVLLNTGSDFQAVWGWSACGAAAPAGAAPAGALVQPLAAPPPPPAVDCAALAPGAYPLHDVFYTAPAHMSGGWFSWFNFAGVDAGAAWIWTTPNAAADAAAGEAFFYATITVAQPTTALVSMSADNQVDVSINGVFRGTVADWGAQASLWVPLAAGANAIELRGVNWGGPAGLIASFRDASTGDVLLNTGSVFQADWKWSPCGTPPPPAPPTPPGPPPAPPVPPAADATPVSVPCSASTPREAVQYVAPARMQGAGFAWLDFSTIDAGANWIWNVPSAVADAAASEVYFQATLAVAATTDAVAFFTADNAAELRVNGDVVGAIGDWGASATATFTLQPGDNDIAVRATNWGGPAGLIASIRDASTGAVLLNTGAAAQSAWTWCGQDVTVDDLVVTTSLSFADATTVDVAMLAAILAVIADETGVALVNVALQAAPAGAVRRQLLQAAGVSLTLSISGNGGNMTQAAAIAAILASPTTLMRVAAAAGGQSVRLASLPTVSARVSAAVLSAGGTPPSTSVVVVVPTAPPGPVAVPAPVRGATPAPTPAGGATTPAAPGGPVVPTPTSGAAVVPGAVVPTPAATASTPPAVSGGGATPAAPAAQGAPPSPVTSGAAAVLLAGSTPPTAVAAQQPAAASAAAALGGAHALPAQLLAALLCIAVGLAA